MRYRFLILILTFLVVLATLALEQPALYAQNEYDAEFSNEIKRILSLGDMEIKRELNALPTDKISRLWGSDYPIALGSVEGIKLATYGTASKRLAEKTRLAAIKTLAKCLRDSKIREVAKALDYQEISNAVKSIADDYPQSIEIAQQVVETYNAYLLATQPYSSVTPEAKAIFEDVRAQKIHTLLPIRNLLNKKYRDEKRWDKDYAIELNSVNFFLYRELIAAFARERTAAWLAPQGFYFSGSRYASISLNTQNSQSTISNYARRQELSPTNGEVASNRDDHKLTDAALRETSPLDPSGAPLFFKTPTSFESAQNDGERICALRKELFELGSKLVKADVLTEQALEATTIFGLENILNLPNRSLRLDVGMSSPSILSNDEIRSLADEETYLLGDGELKRVALPKEYAYQNLWRQAHEYALTFCRETIESETKKNRDYNPHVSLNRDVLTLLALTRCALIKEALLRHNAERIREIDSVYAAFCEKYNLNVTSSFNDQLPAQFLTPQRSLAQLEAPCVAIYREPFSSGFVNSELSLVYRNADAAEIVARRVELAPNVTLETFLEKQQKNPFTPIPSLNSLLYRQIVNNIIDPVFQDVEYFKFSDVKTYSVRFEGDVKWVDQTMKFKLDDLVPGIYLLETTAKKNGKNGGTDKAILWIHELALLRFDTPDGIAIRVFDPKTGEPRSKIDLDVYSFEYSQRQIRTFDGDKSSNEHEKKNVEKQARQEVDYSLVKRTVTTNEEGEAFLNITPQEEGDNVRVFIAARRQGDEEVNLASVLDLNDKLAFRQSEARETGEGFSFISDRPLYQEGEKATFKCWLHPNVVKELDTREVAYVIYDNEGNTLAKKSEVPLDRFGAFSESFEIPINTKDRPPMFSYFVVDIGDKFRSANDSLDTHSNDDKFRNAMTIGSKRHSSPMNSTRFNRYLAGGTLCAQHLKARDKLLKIAVEPLTGALKLGEPLRVKINVSQCDGANVQDGTVQCELAAVPTYNLERDELRKKWDWLYNAEVNELFDPNKRTIATCEEQLDENGGLETAFSTTLDAVLYPKGARTYQLTITARTPDGKLGKIRQDFIPQTEGSAPSAANPSSFTFQVEPSVVFPGQTETIRVKSDRDGKALVRFVDRYGRELRKSEIVEFKDGQWETTIDVDERMTPVYDLELYSICGGKLDCVGKTLFASPRERFLSLKLEYDKTQVQPGAKVKARVMPPTDAEEQPVATSMFVAIYDAALNVKPITAQYRPDVRRKTPLLDLHLNVNAFTNLASTLNTVADANKMCLMPVFHSPNAQPFNLMSLFESVRLPYVDTPAYAPTEPVEASQMRTAPSQMAGVDYLETAPYCSAHDWLLEPNQVAEVEIEIPQNGDASVVEIVAVDEQGRVGYLCEKIEPNR